MMVIKKISSKLLPAYLLACFFALGVVLVVPRVSSAASTAGFQAGNILSDSVLINYQSMSVSDIQNFLNSKVPSCDTNGTQPATEFGYPNLTHAQYAAKVGWSAPPYTCLKDYNENGLSSAQIIYNLSQQYLVNPQVIIVTLQKESSLVTDTWPLPSQYRTATGYGCPDSGPNNSANCNSQYYGLTNQLTNTAKMYHSVETQNPNWYSPYVVGTNYIQWSPNASCGGSNVNIQNWATAALYDYTPYQPNAASLAAGYGMGDSCSAYGNRNFYLYFNDWFGSPTNPAPTACDSQVANIVCVWSLRKNNGPQLLTTSQAEVSSAMYQYGWTNEGIVFYASNVQSAGTVPVYRLQQGSNFFFTADQTEYTTMKNSGWTDGGVAFYALPAASSNGSYKVDKLYNATTSQYYWTKAGSTQENFLLQSGYQVSANTFNSFSGFVSVPTPATGRSNIYRLRNSAGYFYTTNLAEVDAVRKMGYVYEGVVTTANASNTGTAVYRLRYGQRYLYTTSTPERDLAVNSYGYSNEGVVFYVDSNSSPIYRLANTGSGAYLYSSNVYEIMTLANTNGWSYQGALAPAGNTVSPVYRFLNVYNSRHFYTMNINEAAQITNRNWRYETIAFNADTSTGSPVYRLRLNDKYLYTADVNEKNVAVSNYGYVYEQIAFYTGQTTASPVYRLQGGNNEYFYTASSAEKDSAVSKYGYSYEGIGFYLPAS